MVSTDGSTICRPFSGLRKWRSDLLSAIISQPCDDQSHSNRKTTSLMGCRRLSSPHWSLASYGNTRNGLSDLQILRPAPLLKWKLQQQRATKQEISSNKTLNALKLPYSFFSLFLRLG